MSSRSPGRPRIGLALSGGAARGLAHIGVIEVLERENVPVDIVTGTSMGAIVGAMFARGISAAQMKASAKDLSWRHLVDLAPLSGGFLSTRRIKSRLASIIGDVTFADLKRPFACVATDLRTGQPVVFREGPVLEAVIASMSLPLIFRPVTNGGRLLVDGGLVTPLPIAEARQMGAEVVIASNVLCDPRMVRKPRQRGQPGIFDVVMQVVSIASYHLADACSESPDLTIEPDLSGIALGDFDRADEAVLRGELAASDAMPALKHLLAGSLHTKAIEPPVLRLL